MKKKAEEAKIIVTRDNKIFLETNEECFDLGNSPRIVAIQPPKEDLVIHHSGGEMEMTALWLSILSYFKELDQDTMMKTLESITQGQEEVSFPIEVLSTFCTLIKYIRKSEGGEQAPENIQSEIDELLNSE